MSTLTSAIWITITHVNTRDTRVSKHVVYTRRTFEVACRADWSAVFFITVVRAVFHTITPLMLWDTEASAQAYNGSICAPTKTGSTWKQHVWKHCVNYISPGRVSLLFLQLTTLPVLDEFNCSFVQVLFALIFCNTKQMQHLSVTNSYFADKIVLTWIVLVHRNKHSRVRHCRPSSAEFCHTWRCILCNGPHHQCLFQWYTWIPPVNRSPGKTDRKARNWNTFRQTSRWQCKTTYGPLTTNLTILFITSVLTIHVSIANLVSEDAETIEWPTVHHTCRKTHMLLCSSDFTTALAKVNGSGQM